MDTSADSNKPLGPGPKTRVCYICGRQYGVHSYEIHLKQCKELWIAREAQKDPKDRKKLPEDPAIRLMNNNGLSSSCSTTGGTVATGNTALNGDSNGSSGEGGLSLEELNKLASEAFNTETLSQCAYCGRTFLPEKLLIHNRSCTADNPARRVTDTVRKGLPVPSVQAQEPPQVQRPHTTSTSLGRLKKQVDSSKSIKDQLSNVPADGDPVNLKLADGHLVGHLGGSSGRAIRQTNAVQSPKLASTKEEALHVISSKIQFMETTIFTLIESLNDLKSSIEQLQNT